MKIFFVKGLGLYLTMLLCFVLSVVGVLFIPRTAIEENVLSSSDLLLEEGDYPYKFRDYSIFYLDNFTDALMLNISVSADNSHPLNAAMMCYYYGATAWSEGENLKKSASKHLDYLEKNLYGRYWQGYQVILRPLLCFFDLSCIRQINVMLMWLLVAYCLYLVGTKIGCIESLLLLFALLRVNLPIIPYSLQYSNCFYQMLFYCIILLNFPFFSNRIINWALTFFAIGGLTEFFDFLTTPQVTLGIPLILTILAYNYERPYFRFFVASFCWAFGYGLLWASKWVLGYCLTGFDFLSNASSAAKERISDSIGTTRITFEYLFSRKISSLELYVWLILVLLVIGIVVWALRQPNGPLRLKRYSWLLLVALIVPVWYVILLNHTVEHLWFTRRALLVTLFALLIWGKKMIFHRQ